MTDGRVIEGILAERVFDVGTRAERRGFAIVDDGGVEMPVHVVGDNPFESPTLRGLIGHRVVASGTMRGKTLRVGPDALHAVTASGIMPTPNALVLDTEEPGIKASNPSIKDPPEGK